MYNLTKKYIYISEYFNPKPVEVLYHNERKRLYKRDFAKEIWKMYPKLKLVNYGFQWRQDPFFLVVAMIRIGFYFRKINIMCVKLFSKENFCDNCNSKLSLHYTPIKTKRFIKTFKCNKCGLIQSIPQSYFKSHPKPSMSVDADRSSIMYTKKVFTEKHKTV